MLPPEEKQEETAPPKKIQEMTQPPAPWNDWDEVRQVRETLQEHRFLFVKHPQHLTGEEHEVLADLLNSPIGEQIQVLYSFMKDWYAFGYSQDRHRLPPEEALGRYRAWRSNEGYQQNKVLLRILERITPERFDHLYHFLANERWEATNNGAERAGREYHRDAYRACGKSNAALHIESI